MKEKERLQIYRELVDELLRDDADEKKVKRLMLQLGLEYSPQKIDRLSSLLSYNPQKGLTHDL